MCECHDTEQEHAEWVVQETAFWKAYFGDAVKSWAESRRVLREAGIDPDDQNEIQQRLKRSW